MRTSPETDNAPDNWLLDPDAKWLDEPFVAIDFPFLPDPPPRSRFG
jgi:hypothetical protein